MGGLILAGSNNVTQYTVKKWENKVVPLKNRRVGAGDGEWSGRWGWGWGGVGGRGVTDREKAATVGGKMLWWMAVPFPVCVMASCSVM